MSGLEQFEHKHGVKMTFDCHHAATVDLLYRMGMMHYHASLGLQLITEDVTKDRLVIPCKECFRQVALMFRDVASTIDELIGDKAELKDKV